MLRSLLAGASAVTVALGGLLLAPVPAAQAAGTIDQQNPRSAIDFVFDGAVPFEETQTFTAGRTGLLDAVDFDVYEIAAPGTTITATLSAVGGSAPISASGSAPVVSTGWLHIPISQPPFVDAGSTYMITFSASGSGIVRFSTNENYPGGASGANDDLVFRTYVEAGTAPRVSGTLPRATTGQPYSAAFVLQGSPTPTARLFSGSALPPGLTLSPNGVLSGTPTTSGTFEFAVEATNAFGAHSIAATITIDPTLPGRVQGLAVRQEGEQLIASWSAPSVTGGLPLSYRVRVGDRDWQTTTATSLAFDLAPGSRVEITVLAVNDLGFSEPSVVQATRITPPDTPAAPTVVVEGPGSVRVTWEAPAMNGGAPRGYSVLTSSGQQLLVDGTSLVLDVPLGGVQE
ncbi:hypothetical protein, partial [Burkholderia cenocepacia]|uniref:hypothetical protein n=1 Tax=Burkholderia cenocepacia TaxID=95486 RepID=UPI0038CC1E2B